MSRKNRPRPADGVFERRDRRGFWISWIDLNGRRRKRKTDAPTLEQARMVLAEEKRRVEQARILGFAPPAETTFEELAAQFLSYQRARLTPKGYAREAGIVNGHLKPFFAGPIKNVRRVAVQRYIAERAGKASAYSVLHELTCIKHMLRMAVEWELIPFNPAQGVRGPKAPAGRVRFLQPTELKAVVEACPRWLQPVVALAVSTGMRRGEILGLRWLDVDLEGRRILLPQTKNGDGRVVYLNAAASVALASIRPPTAIGVEVVFRGIRPAQVSMAFLRACRAVGIADFRWHDLRHTAASWMRMGGADIHTVASLLGHRDLRMAARYQHLSPGFLAEAVGRLDGIFGDALVAVAPVTRGLPSASPRPNGDCIGKPARPRSVPNIQAAQSIEL